MREYELAVLIRPDLGEEALPAAYEKVRQLIANRGGEIISEDDWGRRRLAYPIGKHMEGNYLITDVRLPIERIKELEASLAISEEVLRHMLIRKGD
ncbi:MAG: 30S ribosomal protein S6 [Dehalococcoidia bacterium]